MQAIVVNYEVLRETIETSSHGTDNCSRRAGGLLAVMDRFSTYFGLKLSILIFSITEQLSVTLQGINTTVNDSYYAVEVCIKALERNRTDEYFQSFFEKVKSEAANKCDPQFYQEDGKSQKELMMEPPHMYFLMLKIYTERSIFRRLTVSRENLRGAFTRTTSFL